MIVAVPTSTTVHGMVVPSTLADATSLGAAFLAGMADGTWKGLDEAVSLAQHGAPVEPTASTDRARWLEARAKAERHVPFLSSISF